jgi:hypothetical protein
MREMLWVQLEVDSRSEFILRQLGDTILICSDYTYRKTQMILYAFRQLQRVLTCVCGIDYIIIKRLLLYPIIIIKGRRGY